MTKKSYPSKLLPDVFVFLIASFCFGLVIFAVQAQLQVRTVAFTNIEPLGVTATNKTDKSLTVSWYTKDPTAGHVTYHKSGETNLVAIDDRDSSAGETKYFTHHVTLFNLEPEAEYLYGIYSNGQRFLRDGQEYRVSAFPLSIQTPPPPSNIYGRILNSSGQPVKDALVYIMFENSSPVSIYTDDEGHYLLNTRVSRQNSDHDRFIQELSQTASLTAQAGWQSISNAKINLVYDRALPDIKLGQNYDLTVTYPLQEEEIAEEQPTFKGTGPSGEEIEVIVE